MQPITFTPIYQQRIWGGRELESVYQRQLPKADTPYGESWEITDRTDEQSIVKSGPHKGKSLHQLWSQERASIFGVDLTAERFPLLIKILDARDDLSIQVHPPAEIAPSLNGEPKTEMWYIAGAIPSAQIYVGLKEGTTRRQFEQALHQGSCEDLVHAITPQVGDSIHIPSGRIHAIGAGLLIYEIQQNSDTTYRVFDWNRNGLDGQPRQLHIEESLACIDFDDFEPTMDSPNGNTLARCPYYHVERLNLIEGSTIGNPDPERFSILTVVSGTLCDTDGNTYSAGDFMLMPRGSHPLATLSDACILQTTIPRNA